MHGSLRLPVALLQPPSPDLSPHHDDDQRGTWMADASNPNGDGQPYRWDPESAKAASEKAAEVRAERAAQRRADPLFLLREKSADLVADLLKAATGQAPYASLPADKRLAALLRALEYGIGRPAPRREPPKPDDEDEKSEEGLSIQ